MAQRTIAFSISKYILLRHDLRKYSVETIRMIWNAYFPYNTTLWMIAKNYQFTELPRSISISPMNVACVIIALNLRLDYESIKRLGLNNPLVMPSICNQLIANGYEEELKPLVYRFKRETIIFNNDDWKYMFGFKEIEA